MAESFRDVLQEAKKNKYCNIWNELSDTDVAGVWDGVSSFIKKNLVQQKGVTVPGFGTFSFTQVKLDVGNNKFIVSQRPVFILSEKIVKTHGLHQKKYTVPGGLPVIPLNLAQLSIENTNAFNRDTIDTCIREVLGALSRCIASGRPVEFTFNGIGRLLVRDLVVKMKFFKNFMQTWDGTGKLVESLQGRPSTADSVMSDAPTARYRSTSVLALPRNCGVDEGEVSVSQLPPINEDAEEEERNVDLNNEERRPDGDDGDDIKFLNVDGDTSLQGPIGTHKTSKDDSASGNEGRVAMAVPQATTFSWDDLVTAKPVPQSAAAAGRATSQAALERPSSMIRGKTTIGNGDVAERRMMTSRSMEAENRPSTAGSCRSSVSSCGHSNAGQELCYVCHQRERRNVYVSFDEERRRKEEEENQLLRDFQQHRDAIDMHKEQEKLLVRRHEIQKTAAYNLSAGEAAAAKNQAKDEDFCPSFVFRRRPLTPPSFIKQEKYRDDLTVQVVAKADAVKQRKDEEDFLGRLEQIQLAEDIAAQRQFYLKQKADKTDAYQRALSAQVKMKADVERPPSSPELLYFASDFEARDEALQEKRRRANELFKEQVAVVEQRKRDAIMRRFGEQRREEDMLQRNKRDTLLDAAERYERMTNNRRALEDEWRRATEKKRERDSDELRNRLEPAKETVLDQCARYRRCGQCQRRLANRGETNVWSETRYIPGCRIMV